MEIEGKIIQELGVQEGVSKAGNAWKKGEWVMETPGMYPKKVKFHVFGESRLADLAPRLQAGKDVVLSVDVESREFNGRWYTDISAYAVREAAPVPGPGGYDQFPGGQQMPPQNVPFGAAPTQPGFGAPAGYPAPPAPGFDAAPAAPVAPAESSDDLPF